MLLVFAQAVLLTLPRRFTPIRKEEMTQYSFYQTVMVPKPTRAPHVVTCLRIMKMLLMVMGCQSG